MSNDKPITKESPPNNVSNNPGGPLVPLCDKCKQPVTRCRCSHNTLQK